MRPWLRLALLFGAVLAGALLLRPSGVGAAPAMLPASVAYCFAGGALVSGQGSAGRTLGYLAVAAVFFAVASLVPGWIRKRYAAELPGPPVPEPARPFPPDRRR